MEIWCSFFSCCSYWFNHNIVHEMDFAFLKRKIIHWERFISFRRLTQYTAMIFHQMKDKALANHTRTPTSGEGNSELAPPHLINGYPLGANTCCRKETLLTVIFLPFAYFSLFYCLPSPNKNPPLVFPCVSRDTPSTSSVDFRIKALAMGLTTDSTMWVLLLFASFLYFLYYLVHLKFYIIEKSKYTLVFTKVILSMLPLFSEVLSFPP